MFSKSLLSSLLLALFVAANPLPGLEPFVKLPMARNVNSNGIFNILKSDQARARQLVARATGNFGSQCPSVDGHGESITNKAMIYTASVGIGSPPSTYDLIIDTGSSNTWVGATKSYNQTTTSVLTGDSVSVSYGSGSFTGTEYFDDVKLGNFVVKNQSVGVAASSSGFTGFDGILGIGPTGLTIGTLFPHTTTSIPTVTENAFSQKKISANMLGVSFEPATKRSVQNGELTWGGIDSTKYTGTLHYVPITKTSPASFYWGIDQSITYGTESILSSSAGIVDTGTTLVLIASDAFDRYKKATGAVSDSTTSLLKITPSQYSALKPLNFNINGQTYTLTPNAQIWPRSLNSAIGGAADSIYLVVANLGTNSGQGLDFINGYAFLERHYSVFDTTNKRVGLATTSFTTATSN
ncbi:hypothetical protein APHAL10511_005744 [Amanita phalloides]|nr:hypothetical protein APHAL10511_005744 [Amanita phalloides]